MGLEAIDLGEAEPAPAPTGHAAHAVPTIEHAGFLEDLTETPGCLLPGHLSDQALLGKLSCSFCGIGDGATMVREAEESPAEVVPSGSGDDVLYRQRVSVFKEILSEPRPTTGCVKFRHSMMRQRPAYPIHVAPSVLGAEGLGRQAVSYDAAIARFADLLLAHRGHGARTLVYASGQIDYFAVFALQEVFRILGVRNLTGNAEHCLNAGAVHNEILTGQEGPFVTVAQAVSQEGCFYLFNGWNGYVSHPPVFRSLLARPDCDAFLVEVMVTESAKALAKTIGKDRVLLVKSRSDPHLALAVAHTLLTKYPEAIHHDFVARFSDGGTFKAFTELAASPQFSPERVAERIAPEPEYVERILHAIRLIARKMATPGAVPVNIPSVGLSQTSGVVAHCLWGSVMALVGKYGLNADGTLAGGTLRLPGQINAETEVQGLSRNYFMGRIPMKDSVDAATRMGLPGDAYDAVLRDPPTAALDYSEPTQATAELIICVGTQFEANMMDRQRWLSKLETKSTSLVVIDPIPGPYAEAHAHLVIPSPPHPATPKLYQNGEWKLTLSVPQKRAPVETRSDATILYDVMAEISHRVSTDPSVALAHPDLAAHAQSGYLARRFGSPDSVDAGGLTRVEGEVSRVELWDRVIEYMSGGAGPIYCRPEHADGRPIAWTELLEQGSVYYGGVGVTRFLLDYENPSAHPFRDILRRPRGFRFFVPTAADLEIPDGVIFNSGRSSLSDDRTRIAFATSTFNSGKATPVANMPDEHPLFVSPSLAALHQLATGDRARVKNPSTGRSIELPVIVSDRVKGNGVYTSFHKSRAQMDRGVFINDVTSREGRCPYCSQTNLKATPVLVEQASRRSTMRPTALHVPAPPRSPRAHLDPAMDYPRWLGQNAPVCLTDIIHETHDVYTLRFQGDPLCRFAYQPGQFCSFVLNIDNTKVVRSYSISSTPTRPFSLEVTIKRVPGGLVSNWLIDNLRVGDHVDISGPKGKFCISPDNVPPKVLFLGAGSGITPLISMTRWLCDISAKVDIKLFNSVRSPNDVIFERELEMLSARHHLLQPTVVTSSRGAGRGWTGLTGRISQTMLQLIAPDLHEREVYVCGPTGFMEACRTLLGEAGFNLARLHSESFGGLRTSVARKSLPPMLDSRTPINRQALLQALRGPEAASETAETSGALSIEFAKAGKSHRADGRLPILEVAEANDIDIEYGCRTGHCGDCKVRLLRGEVKMDCDDGLTAADRAAGYVLACVARPLGPCVVDA